jgi:hypothetical protein
MSEIKVKENVDEKIDHLTYIELLIEELMNHEEIDKKLRREEMIVIITNKCNLFILDRIKNLLNHIYEKVKFFNNLKIEKLSVQDIIIFLTENLKEEVNNEINKLNDEKESSYSIDSKNLESAYQVNHNQNFENKDPRHNYDKMITTELNSLRDPKPIGGLLETHENLTDFDMNYDKYTKNFHFDEYIFTNEIPYENTVLPTNSFPRFELNNIKTKKFPNKENLQRYHEYISENSKDSYKHNHGETINEDMVYPINPKKVHKCVVTEPEVINRKKFPQMLHLDSNGITLMKNYENVHHVHKKILEKPQIKINIKPKAKLEEEDFFFQIFRNVSNQKKKLQIFTEKIFNISKRNRLVGIEIDNNSDKNYLKMPNDFTKNSFQKTSNLIESEKDNKILELIKNLKREIIKDSIGEKNTEILGDDDVKKFKLHELANTDYDLNKRDEKEKYVNSIRKNIKNFIIKKSEFRQNREDVLVEFESKFEDMIQNRRNNDVNFYNKPENLEEMIENKDDKIISEISDRKSIQDMTLDYQSRPQEEKIENESQIELSNPNENIYESEIDNNKQVENVSDYKEKSIENEENEIVDDINSR